MGVAVVIVTYNSETAIEDCISSIEKQQVSQILVVDNASTDNTVSVVRKHFKTVKLFSLLQNRGYAGGNNFGIDEALKLKIDYILVLNPDTIFELNTLANLLSAAEKHRGQGIFGPKILMENGKRIWSAGGELDKKRYTAGLTGYQDLDREYNDYHIEREFDFVSGTCMLIPRKLFKKGLRFYEDYFLYYEDVEFCVRAKKLGYPSFLVTEAKIIHLEKSKDFSLKNYYLARNHLLFVERNAPFRIKLREMIRLPKTIYEHAIIVDWNSMQGVRDYFFRRFGMPGKINLLPDK